MRTDELERRWRKRGMTVTITGSVAVVGERMAIDRAGRGMTGNSLNRRTAFLMRLGPYRPMSILTIAE